MHAHTHTHTHLKKENGMLATRIEILARYHGDTVQKLGKAIRHNPSVRPYLQPVCRVCREEDNLSGNRESRYQEAAEAVKKEAARYVLAIRGLVAAMGASYLSSQGGPPNAEEQEMVGRKCEDIRL